MACVTYEGTIYTDLDYTDVTITHYATTIDSFPNEPRSAPTAL